MPLTRDRILGHDSERLAFRFTMRNGADIVECQISDAALDELAGAKGTESMARPALFSTLRDTVEEIASGIFDTAPHVRGQIVRIFTKHIRKPQAGEPAVTVQEPGVATAASLRAFAERRSADAAE
jgi:hypothetical protein